HFYGDKGSHTCRVFEITLSKEFEGKYKQLIVEKINQESSVEFAAQQVQALENNKRSIDALLADKDKLKFIFELDKHHSCNVGGQFENIEDILDTF
ncbi:MAG TPA: hypothetical protein VF941_17710, partial [Clostridia bacterium]